MRVILSRNQKAFQISLFLLAALGAIMNLIGSPTSTMIQLGFLGLIIYWSNRPPTWLQRLVSVGPVVYRQQPVKKVSAKKNRKFRVIDGNK
ncbi:hypothetical protein [Risungbinella massiliensis]|uniref:hypothetical protein n=1 Tax=Risungbinella massiliensis TaxID=1329796 RepID=UPI0005CBAE84|nr:hypothetical protein [Risungbinella massiliensis]